MTAASLTPRTVRSKWNPLSSNVAFPATLGLVFQRVQPFGNVLSRGGAASLRSLVTPGLSTPAIAACSMTFRL